MSQFDHRSSHARKLHIHLFLICILWLRSHLKAKSWKLCDSEFFIHRQVLLFQMRVIGTILNFLIYSANNDNIDRYCMRITKICGRLYIYISRVKLYLIIVGNYITYRFYPRDATSRTFSCTISLDCSP